MISFVYDEEFNKYDLGLDHPLIGDKPKRIFNLIKAKKFTDEIDIFKPNKATVEDLQRAHSKKYIEIIKELSKKGGMLSLDTPAPKGIFDIASLATGGTILAAEKLFNKYEISVNPLAGFHHAGRNSSSGFCFFNDIAVVIEYLREKKKLKKFLVIDLDVHHGNGTQEIYCEDKTVLNLSFHQDGRTLYPGTGKLEYIGKEKAKGYTINLPLPPGTGSNSYLYAVDQIIPRIVEQFKPEIIIYQSGVDTHHSDPLADLYLSYQTYYHLAQKIKKLSEEHCKKLLVLFGGGYNSDASTIAYYNIICALLEKTDYIRERDDFSYQKYNPVKNLVSELQKVLQPYWSF